MIINASRADEKPVYSKDIVNLPQLGYNFSEKKDLNEGY